MPAAGGIDKALFKGSGFIAIGLKLFFYVFDIDYDFRCVHVSSCLSYNSSAKPRSSLQKRRKPAANTARLTRAACSRQAASGMER